MPACAQLSAPDVVAPSTVAVSTSFPVFLWNNSDPVNGNQFQLATDAGMGSVIMSSITSNSFIHSTVALSDATTYYWRARSQAGLWPPQPFNFVVDLSTPVAASPQASTNGGTTWTPLGTGAYVNSTAVTVRLQVQDSASGLLVSTPQPVGLVGQWHLNEGSGTYTLDGSSNSSGGVLDAGTQWTAGKRGPAVWFPGTGAGVTVPYDPTLSVTSDFTLETWVKTTETAQYSTVLSNYAGGGGYILGINQAAVNSGDVYLWASAAYRLATPAQMGFKINDGLWHHIAAVHTGGMTHLYVDGMLRGSTAGPAAAASGQPTVMGAYASGAYSLTGAVDEVRVYNVARSSYQILSDYQSDLLGAGADAGASGATSFGVACSTNAGRTWNRLLPASQSLGGSNGVNSAQWLRVDGLSLVTSTGPGAPTNLVAFTVSDMAGNVSQSTYAVLVDTAIPVPIGPADGAYVDTSTPVMVWTSLWGPTHRVQLSLDSGFTQIVEDGITANDFYVTTNTLTHGATYWWRVGTGLSSGFWASSRTFVVDIGSPSLSAAAVSPDAAAWVGLPSAVYVSTTMGSFHVSVQDSPSGLMASTSLPSGLVGQWHLDEGSGTYVLDSSTNGFMGAVMGGPTWTAGRPGAALSFDGANDYVNVANDPVLSLVDSYTIEAWIKTTSVAMAKPIVSNFNGALNGYILEMSHTAAGDIGFWANGVWGVWAGLGANDGSWHHVAVKVVKTAAELFFDGSTRGIRAIGDTNASGQPTTIGRRTTTANYWAGVIDEVRLYNVARSTAEILADFESDQLGAHNNAAAYSVSYSTNAGATWTLVSTSAVRLTTTNNRDTGPQTLQADGIPLVTSTGTLAPTDLVAVAVSDYSGQVSTAAYVVYVDTLTRTAVSTPSYPCDGCTVNGQPNFEWHGPSTRTVLDLQLSNAYLLQVSSDDASFGASNVVVSVTTPAVIMSTMAATDDAVYLSTYTLTPGATYYWRVAPRDRLGNLGPWSRVFSFTRDPAAPAAGAFVSLSTGGAVRGEGYYNGLLSGATVQLLVSDPLSGLAVTTGTMPGAYLPASSWFGVDYSTDAGRTWISESTAAAQTGLQDGVYSMAVFNGRLYAGTGGAGYGKVLVWDGTQWNSSYDGTKSGIQALAVFQGKLYAAQSGAAGDGDVWVCDPALTGDPGVCDRDDWFLSFNGGQNAIYALAVYGDKLYAAQGGGAGAGDIFVYDGNSWQVSFNTPQTAMYALAVYDGRLYAGQGGAAGAEKVYVFDGSSWTVSYAGAQQAVNALAVYDGKLYAGRGGAAGSAAVLSFNGTSWTTAWTPPAPTDMVSSLAPYNGKLFAGLGSAAGSGNLAVYDGWSWSVPYRSGTSRVFSLMPYDGSLFLGVGGGGADGAVVRSSRSLSVSLTGKDGEIGTQTLSATGLNLVFSTNTTVCGGVSPCGATNQVRFHVTDEGGNVLHAGPFAVLVDTNPPAAPSVPSVLSISSADLRLGWGTVSSSHPVVYELQVSTKPDYSGTPYSTWTVGTSAWALGLSPSTTYYSRVRASHVTTGQYSTSLTTVTWTIPVSAAWVGAVYRTSASVQWTPLPPDVAQGFLVTASTASDSSGILITSTTSNGLSSQLTVLGLARATTYYFRVISLNWAGGGAVADAGWARTLPGDPPVSPVVPAGGVFLTSATLSWGSVAADTGYVAQASTVPDFSSGLVLSSDTVDGSAQSLTVLNLDQNTTYYLRVGSRWNTTSVFASPSPASYSTMANPVPSPAFAGLYWSSITVTWTPLPSSPQSASCEGYRLEAWTAPDFTGTVFSSAAARTAAGSLTVSGLSGNTTYYFRLASFNWGGVPSYSYPGAAMTVPPAPGSPAVSAVYLSSVTAQWTPVGSKNGYVVQAALAQDFAAPVAAVTPSGAASSLPVTGLSANTTYYVRVGALRDGVTSYAYAPVPAATLSNPVAGTISRVPAQSSVTVYWTPLPASPSSSSCEGYRLEASAASDFSGSVSAFFLADPAGGRLSATGLLAHTTYYFRLATLNWASALTYVQAGSTVTDAGPAPAGAALAAVFRTSATVSWTPVPSQDGYVAELSQQSDFSGAMLASATVSGSASALTVTGLDPNTRYYARAGSLWNGATSYAAAGNVPTLPVLPGGMAFSAVNLTSVTVSWTPLPTAPQKASAEGYRLEASPSPDFSGTVLSSATSDVQVAALTLSSLTWNSAYYFRLGSVGWDGRVAYLAAVSTRTVSISSGAQAGSSAMTLSLVPTYPQVTLVTLRVPAGAFPAGTRVELGASVPALPAGRSNQARLIPLGPDVGVEITASGQQPAVPVTLQLTYDPARLPAGSKARQLVVATYSPSAGQWTLLPTSVDETNHVLTCTASHFSLFAPFAVGAVDDLGSVQAFPVPWEPGSGSRFDTPSISFTSLPEGAKVEVFSIMGESVWDGEADGAGTLRWDGRSRGGGKAASGTYIAVVAAGGRKATRRVVVIR